MIWRDIRRIRADAPLVHNITNYVVMNTTANALLAIGASPVMAHALDEVEEMAGLAQALVINIGTLSTLWIAAMFRAGKVARRRNIPIILDPVGCGATQFRTTTARQLLQELQPTIVRGNASEIRALIGSAQETKGVDSRHSPEEARDDALALGKAAGCVVSVSGAEDLVTDGSAMARIANGHPLMSRVTGMGCTASALTGAFAAVNASPFAAATHAMAAMGIAGELAAERAQGPGSFQMHFLDVLHGLQEADIAQRIRMRGD